MKQNMQETKRRPISFNEFKSYCQKIVPLLNDPDTVEKQNEISLKDTKKQVLSYKASYKILSRKFAKQHDCEYLEIQQLRQVFQQQITNSQQKKQSQKLSQDTNPNKKSKKVLLKINITYSLSYQIPLLLFMPYHVVTNNNHHIKKSQTNQQQCISSQQNDQQPTYQLIPFSKQQISRYMIINPTIGSQKLNPRQDQSGVFIIQNHINKEYFYTLHHCYMDTYQMDVAQIVPYYLAIIGCHPQIMFKVG